VDLVRKVFGFFVYCFYFIAGAFHVVFVDVVAGYYIVLIYSFIHIVFFY